MADAAEIYALCDPDTGETRYIGKAKCSTLRLKRHLSDRTRLKYPVYNWINKLAVSGKRPSMKVLELANDWREAERRLIAKARADGCRLLNVAEGGDEPHCSPENRTANAKKMNVVFQPGTVGAHLRERKRYITHAISRGEVSNLTRAKLRAAAQKHPDIFGLWASLEDRVE
jgi:hypothetical protein